MTNQINTVVLHFDMNICQMNIKVSRKCQMSGYYFMLKMLTYINSFLWCTDRFIAKVLGEYEAGQSILQPCPHPNTLSWTAPLVNMIPHLCDRINQSHMEQTHTISSNYQLEILNLNIHNYY